MSESVSNDPALWRADLRFPGPDTHKYDRGHLVVLGGTRMTGAARLASEAGMRAGAGVCTVVSSADVRDIYLKGAPHVMFEPYERLADFARHLDDPRRTAAVMGPGAGRDDDEALRQAVIGALATGKPVALDADALNVFEGCAQRLFDALHAQSVLTPHEGELARLFPGLDGSGKAAEAARLAGAVVLLKGASTTIASPDGRTIVNTHATPWLATAGSGDVLAGIIGGFLAQGMDCFMASCAAAWIHGEAGIRFGPGLTAPDIIAGIPGVLRDFA